jgi:hypothetical protein
VTGLAARFAARMRHQPADGVVPGWLPTRLAHAAVQVLPGVGGAGISVQAGPGRRIPVGASDDVAATAERVQFSMGEGPSVPAHISGGAVIATGTMIAGRWPLLYQELTARTPYRAVLSLPLRYRPTGIGALDLYLLQDDGELTLGALPDVATVADQIVTALAEPDASARQHPGRAGPGWLDSPCAQRRQRIWAAVDLLSAQLNLPVPDALDTLRAAAFGSGRFLDDLVEDLTTRRSPLSDLQG